MSRWAILATLALIRLSFGYQFQSMAALAPQIAGDLALDQTQAGTLIGLYWAPGVLVALPGGWLGRRFGDKPMVIAGGVLTVIGGAICALAPSYEALAAGRLIAGLGGIVMNVLAVKMTTDWFAAREIGFAMGALFGSFPLGIALGLAVQAPLAASLGWPWVMASTALLAAAVVVAIGLLYRGPANESHPPQTVGGPGTGALLRRHDVALVSLAGIGLALYNGSFLVYVSYAPALLTENGIGVAASGLILALASALSTVFLPLGGHLADRSGRPLTVLFSTTLAFCLCVALLPPAAAAQGATMVVALAVLISVLGALPAPRRALGLGLFYTWFYVGAALCPALGGWLYDATGTPAGPIYLIAGLGFATAALYAAFARLARRKGE